jgi:hypothetical protein
MSVSVAELKSDLARIELVKLSDETVRSIIDARTVEYCC